MTMHQEWVISETTNKNHTNKTQSNRGRMHDTVVSTSLRLKSNYA